MGGGGVQSPSCVRLFATPWTAAGQASLSLTISWSLPKFMSIESVMPSNHLIICHLLLLPASIFPRIRGNESELCMVAKVLKLSASVLPVSFQGWFSSLRLTGLISLLSKGFSKVLSSTTFGDGWCSGKEPTWQCRRCKRCRFIPWVGKILWNRKRQPSPVFLPRKFHGQGSLVGYSPWDCKKSDMTERLITHTDGRMHSQQWSHTDSYCSSDSTVSIPLMKWFGKCPPHPDLLSSAWALFVEMSTSTWHLSSSWTYLALQPWWPHTVLLRLGPTFCWHNLMSALHCVSPFLLEASLTLLNPQ